MLVEFTFKGGTKQIKKVILHEVYLNIIKNSKSLIDIYKSYDYKKFSEVEKNENDRLFAKHNAILKSFDSIDWITDQSPLGKSIFTGLLVLPKNQGGSQEVKVEILEYF